MKTLAKSLVVEAALAGLFLSVTAAPALADDHGHAHGDGAAPKAEAKAAKAPAKKAATVHCLGVNACKGTSECGVEGKHGCKGHNECKGAGWTSLTKKECKKQKGTVQGAKAAKAEPVKAEPAKAETAPAAK